MSNKECYVYNFNPRCLRLIINQYGTKSLEVELINQQYSQQQNQKLKQILLLLSMFFLYYFFTNLAVHNEVKFFQRTSAADLGFIIYVVYVVVTTCKLVKREKLVLCQDFGMQLQTERFLSRSNVFISAPNIHDVHINEIIENLEVHYIIVVRTKGDIFKEKPIITLFNAQKPPIDCLETIYKHFNKILSRE